MKTYRKQLVLFAVIVIVWSCGIKSPPIPKESLNIPYPTNFELVLSDKGIVVLNGSDDYTILVEKAVNEETLFSNKMFKRVSMIKPDSSFLDENVQEGLSYTYRFKNYNPQYNTYSAPITKTIRFFAPVIINEVKIKQYENTLCLNTELNNATEYAVVNINGRNVGKILKDGAACFNLPGSLIVNIMIIPYNFDGNSGTPYKTTLKRDESSVLLPPQNIKALRSSGSVILTWDKMEYVDSYNIYLKKKDSLELLETTDITLYQHSIAPNQKCIDFEISSVRGSQESDKVKVTSCP